MAFYELFMKMDWASSVELSLMACGLLTVILIVIWLLPLALCQLLRKMGVFEFMFPGITVAIRMVIILTGLFVMGAELGYPPGKIVAVAIGLCTVAASLAFQDQIINTIYEFQMSLYQVYSIGTHVRSVPLNIDGRITTMNAQFLTIVCPDTGRTVVVPNRVLCSSIIEIVPDHESLNIYEKSRKDKIFL